MRTAHYLIKLSLLLFFLSYSRTSFAQALDGSFYTIGSPTVVDYFIDPLSGNDAASGLNRNNPKRTVTAIWNAIPENQTLTSGYRINLLPGLYGTEELPNYWENRKGSITAPIILQALDGYGTVFFTRDINMAGTDYFYLIGINIKNQTTQGYGDAFHCERCSYILLRGNSFNGAPEGRDTEADIAHETIKFNQSQYIYIENNNIQGAEDNGIDWVAVQYGHIRANRIHDTDGWCTYVKGGSSYILIESNIVYDCGEGGVTAGQGTGFEFMSTPWLNFEANYIKIVNNLIYNIDGAALGVNGGYQILVAHNTAYHVGERSHLLEVVFGERSCDGDLASCAAQRSLGGWGSTTTDSVQPIGNNEVNIFNNIFYNPTGFTSGSQHFAIYGPRVPTVSGIPSPQVSDENLRIKGNIIWNGSPSFTIGIEDTDQGCQSGNASCNQTQLLSDNLINTTEPDFVNAAFFDLRPLAGGALEMLSSSTIPDFVAIDSGLTNIPEGVRDATLFREFSNAAASSRPPGAFVNSSSSLTFPSSDGVISTPSNGTNNQAPSLTGVTLSAKRKGKKVTVKISSIITDNDQISLATASISAKTTILKRVTLNLGNDKYVGTSKVKTSVKKLKVMIRATDSFGSTTSVQKSVKIK